MRIFMTGGTGFVGTYLSGYLAGEGHEVTILTSSFDTAGASPGEGIAYLPGNPTVQGPWQEKVRDHDVIINLAGASIFHRWNRAYKEILRQSRIQTTRNLVEALDGRADKQVAFLSTSAVGYYGFTGDEELAEDAPAGTDFLARLAHDWEQEALRARDKGARVIITRFGIVLGKAGGALGQMIPLFRLGLGGPLASGRQWFSWVHLHDLARAFAFLIGHQSAAGPINLCAPQPVRNRDLARAIGKVLKRPAILPAPGFMIRLILGEFGSVLLKGQRVIPRALQEQGFGFHYPMIHEALRNIVGT
ncbi:MAG: TIGR01777 family oxidoreductase [Syntrophaceae bacterium]